MADIKVLLVDDHALVRAGIKSLIDRIPDFSVVAEASGIAEALQKIAKAPPDFVVTDITMGADNGLDLVALLKEKYPSIVVIVFSMHASEDLVAESLRQGALAYLLKESATEELEAALRSVRRGEIYLSSAVSGKTIARLAQPAKKLENPLHNLTARQIQILKMIAEAKGTKEIAYDLDLSEKTVAAHRAQIMERIGIRDVVGLVLFAVKHGLVKVP